MKKIVLLIVLSLIGIGVLPSYAQSPKRFVNFTPAYPLAIGNVATDSFQYTHSGLDLCDIIQDSLPVYEIGSIYDKTVDYTESGIGFYVKADSLHSDNVSYSISVDSLPTGPIEFNSTTGRFKYFPDTEDYRTFYVTFSATDGTDTVSEIVKFVIRPQVVPEQYSINNKGVFPYGEDYSIVATRVLDTIMFNIKFHINPHFL